MEGAAQSMGFPVNLAIICNWFPKKGRGLIVGIWASCQPVGDIIGIQLFEVMCKGKGKERWGSVFLVLGGLILLMSLLNQIFLYATPQKKGLVVLETASLWDNEQILEKGESQEKELLEVGSQSEEKLSFCRTIMLPGVFAFGLAYFCLKFVLYGVMLQLPTFLEEFLNFSEEDAAEIASFWGLGAIAGNVVLGMLSDFFGLRAPFFTGGLIAGGLILIKFSFAVDLELFSACCYTFSVGFFAMGAAIVMNAIMGDIAKKLAS